MLSRFGEMHSSRILTAGIFCFLFVSYAYGQGPKDPKDYKVGEPNFSLQGQGGGKNLRNFGAGYNAGVGTKVWESKNRDRSLELGVNYGQSVFRHQGHTFKSKPQYGVGGTFRWGKK